MTQRVIVIGGGVIGTACAYLNKCGWDVTVVEQEVDRQRRVACQLRLRLPESRAAAGWSGVMGRTIRAMLSSERRRFRSSHGSTRRCGAVDAGNSPAVAIARHAHHRPAIQSLLNESRRRVRRVVASETLDGRMGDTRSAVRLSDEGSRSSPTGTRTACWVRQFGLRPVRLRRRRVGELEPALKPGLAGGWHYEGDAHLRPDKLMSSWRTAARITG